LIGRKIAPNLIYSRFTFAGRSGPQRSIWTPRLSWMRSINKTEIRIGRRHGANLIPEKTTA
jgi:hypothetical protein